MNSKSVQTGIVLVTMVTENFHLYKTEIFLVRVLLDGEGLDGKLCKLVVPKNMP